MQLLDPLGAIFSLLATYYLTQARIIAWPVSLCAISVNIILYYQSGIYGNVGLQLVYLSSCIYGWYIWRNNNSTNNNSIVVKSLPYLQVVILAITALIGIVLLAYTLNNFTNSTIPYLDATTTILALIAQWLMCRQIIQTWLVWFIVDAVNMGIYIHKGIPYHSLLMLIYLCMAVIGYLRWRHTAMKTKQRILALD